MMNLRWTRCIQLAAALGTMSLAAACGGSDDSDQSALESDLVEADDGAADEPSCESVGDSCQTCSEHLADIECPTDNLCSGSSYLHDQMRSCACDHCGDACGAMCGEQHEGPLTQECASCALDQCNPEVSACANDRRN